jgi:hypothetical protein
VDYAGYCINLAVRLQDHCPAVGFIIHQPVNPKIDGLLAKEAVKMKGSMDEPVYIFEEDYKRLSPMDGLIAHLKLTPPAQASRGPQSTPL